MGKPVPAKCPCKDTCFAKINGKCIILTEIPKGRCHFRKPDREWTDGKYYPYNPTYCDGRAIKNEY